MWKFAIAASVLGPSLCALRIYFAGRVCHCTKLLTERVIIVTGGNSGIGKALAIELARRDCTLVLACRDVKSANAARSEIIEEIKVNRNTQVVVKHLDLSSFQSIINFSKVIHSEFREIYALVNNAGVFYHPHQLTEDGYDVTYQTNYLGPFLLTHLLVDVLSKKAARVINVTSEAYNLATVNDLDTITNCQSESHPPLTAYSVSKLALTLFTRHLSKTVNPNIVVTAVNPGNVETPIFRHFFFLNNWFLYAIQWPIRFIVVKQPFYGAQTSLHCILAPKLQSGQYYSECNIKKIGSLASDEHLARTYYENTAKKLTKYLPK